MVTNPVTEDFLRPERIRCRDKAGAVEVIRRRWLFLDVDPAKPDEFKKHSATEAEKEAAVVLGLDVLGFLQAQGWHVPLRIDSGNGNYLLYRIDLPNDADTRLLVRSFLHAIGDKFTGARGKIGMECSNADRLMKLPGSTAAKGPNTSERPHRPCRLVHVPEVPSIITADQIRAVVAALEKKSATNGTSPKTRSKLKRKTRADRGGCSPYGLKALEEELEKLRSTTESEGEYGGRNGQLNASGFVLFQLVAGGELTEEVVTSGLRDAARACGLYEDEAGERGVEGSIESSRNAGSLKPRSAPGQDNHAANADEENAHFQTTYDGEILADVTDEDMSGYDAEQLKTRGGVRQFHMHSMPALMAMDIPEPRWLVPGILSEGLNILAGKPKQGKSMMALNLALTIAAGGLALGNIRTVPGDVLYLSLEDKERRVQYRARQMLAGLGVEISSRLTVATHCPNQGKGGLQFIDLWAKRADRPSLVIIDVWGRFKPPHNAKGSAYEQDYLQMATLKSFIEQRGCNTLNLLHCRKMKSEDVLEEVSGTMGLSGAADGIVVLSRSRSSNEAKIFITGRDVSEQELALEFDDKTFCWKSLGPSDAVLTGKLQVKILDYMKLQPGVPLHTRPIADAIHNTPDGIRPVLHRLRDRGIIRQHGNAWVYPGPGEGALTETPDSVEF